MFGTILVFDKTRIFHGIFLNEYDLKTKKNYFLNIKNHFFCIAIDLTYVSYKNIYFWLFITSFVVL